MDNLNELKMIWRSSTTDQVPDLKQMLSVIKKYRRKILFKKLLVIGSSLLLIGLMIAVVVFYKSSLISTRLGEALFIGSALILLSTNLYSIKRVYRFTSGNSKDYLQFLEKTRINQLYYYKKTQPLGLALNIAGLLLYNYEMVRGSLILLIVTYILTLGYAALIWFVVRPRAFKKYSGPLNDKIGRLKKILDHLNEPS